MKQTGLVLGAVFALGMASLGDAASAPRQMENLGRGVVAINQGGGKVFVRWRLLGTELDSIAFNVYRTVGGGAPVNELIVHVSGRSRDNSQAGLTDPPIFQAYSLDGATFTDFGEPYPFAWGHYRGSRIGIYSCNNQAEAGYVDVDWLHHDYAGPSDRKE